MDSRQFARCVFVGCSNHSWGATQNILVEHATRQGWVETPAGWVCPAHVQEQLARVALGGE